MGPKVGMPENMEEKTICCLVLDDSASMGGSPINELNQGIQVFMKDIENNDRLSNGLEIAIIKFGERAAVVQDAALIDSVEVPTLQANDGRTDLNMGVNEAINLVEERKTYYKQTHQSYKRPWIILVTDGAPTDGGLEITAEQIEEDTKAGKYVFLPIGVDGADISTLQKLSGYMGEQKMSPMSMDSAKFREVLSRLSLFGCHFGQVNTYVRLSDPGARLKGLKV